MTVTVVWMVQPLQDILSTALAGAEDLDLGWLVAGVQEIGSVITVDIAGVLSGILGVGLVIVLTLLLTFLFLRDGGRFWDQVIDRLRGPGASTSTTPARSRWRCCPAT